MRTFLGFAVLVGLAAAACDSRATASDPPGGGPSAEQRSREYESCGATLHCADGLRCFDHACRRTTRSTVGDYQAALGALARARGDHDAAIAAYAAALGHYDAEKVALPPEIDCAYGAALAAAGKKEHHELGARVLHRCVLAVPVGSALRDQALAHLATLDAAGLDPLRLAASKTGDLYLTRAPKGPSVDRLAVTVSSAPPLSAKSAPVIAEMVSAQKAGLIACWEAYYKAAKREAMAVTLALKASYVAGDYEDDPVRFVVKLTDAAAAGTSPDAVADACVRQLVEPQLKALKLGEAFTTKLTIGVK